jgi:hypothetical protein
MKAPIAADDFQSAVVDDHAVANRAAFGRSGRSARLRPSQREGGGDVASFGKQDCGGPADPLAVLHPHALMVPGSGPDTDCATPICRSLFSRGRL